MVYFILSIILIIFLIGFSSLADSSLTSEGNRHIINNVLMLTIVTVCESLAMMMAFWFNEQIVSFLMKLMFCVLAWFSVSFSLWVMRFPNNVKSTFLQVVKFALEAAAIYIMFTQVSSVEISQAAGIVVTSADMQGLPITWFQLYLGIFVIILPGLSFLTLLLRFESVKNRLVKQQMIAILAVLAVGALSMYATVCMTDSVAPAFDLLFPFVLALVLFLIYWDISRAILVDLQVVSGRVVSIFLNYVLVSIVAGVVFSLLQPLRTTSVHVFQLVYMLFTGALLVISYQASKLTKRILGSRESNYSDRFEKQLQSIDYSEGLEVIEGRLDRIFKENVNNISLDLLIETGETELVPLYSTRDRQIRIPLDNKLFDIALNAQKTIIFRTHAENNHELAPARREFMELFNSTGTEVLIILNEGRRVFGAILLGQKRLGNAYTDYDYSVFSKLYSHFFVIGYYLKNIANESVVGTVNREIQMSGQIIQSIQENMDFINNPKVDVGYLSVAAHNLGGEYLDFIRLSDTRHMIILGDISGKGINASMSTVILKSVVRTFLNETTDFKQLVQKVNMFIRDNLPKGTYLSGIFALMDFTDNTMYYINCGIPALFLYNRAYNNVIEIQGEGRVLGFVKNVDRLLKVKKIVLNPGDVLLSCTDGLLEAKSVRGDEFGKDRVQRSLMENLSFPSSKIAQFLHQEVLDYISRELEDDVSIVAIKCISK